MAKYNALPSPSVRRLPLYLALARQAEADGVQLISGTVLANTLGLDAIQVRKDLAITGISGKPKIGYPVRDLVHYIEVFLDWQDGHKAILIGAGNLGSALLGYQGFKKNALNFVAAFDIDSSIIGKTVHDIKIYNLSDLPVFMKHHPDAEIAVLAVPPAAAQGAAEVLENAGIRSIWNFTTVRLKVSASIIVQNEDLLSGYALLSACMRIQRQ